MVTDERAARWSEMDADVREFVDPTFGVHLPGSPLVYEASSPEALEDHRLERAVQAGAFVWLMSGACRPGSPLSLGVLDQVLPDLRGLWIDSETLVTELEHLTRAVSLEELYLEQFRSREFTDLGDLPNLQHVAGSARDIARILPNGAKLESLSLLPPYKTSAPSLQKGIGDLTLVSLPQRAAAVRLVEPTATRVVTLKGAQAFNLESLAGCNHLERLHIFGCGELRGLHIVETLAALQELTIELTSSPEPWETLLRAEVSAAVILPLEGLDADTARLMRSRGWQT